MQKLDLAIFPLSTSPKFSESESILCIVKYFLSSLVPDFGYVIQKNFDFLLLRLSLVDLVGVHILLKNKIPLDVHISRGYQKVLEQKGLL